MLKEIQVDTQQLLAQAEQEVKSTRSMAKLQRMGVIYGDMDCQFVRSNPTSHAYGESGESTEELREAVDLASACGQSLDFSAIIDGDQSPNKRSRTETDQLLNKMNDSSAATATDQFSMKTDYSISSDT